MDWADELAARVAARGRRDHARAKRRVLALADAAPRSSPAEELDEAIACREVLALMERFAEGLDPAMHEVFAAWFFDGRTPQEIADALGLSRNTVFSRLRLIRARLQRVCERIAAHDDATSTRAEATGAVPRAGAGARTRRPRAVGRIVDLWCARGWSQSRWESRCRLRQGDRRATVGRCGPDAVAPAGTTTTVAAATLPSDIAPPPAASSEINRTWHGIDGSDARARRPRRFPRPICPIGGADCPDPGVDQALHYDAASNRSKSTATGSRRPAHHGARGLRGDRRVPNPTGPAPGGLTSRRTPALRCRCGLSDLEHASDDHRAEDTNTRDATNRQAPRISRPRSRRSQHAPVRAASSGTKREQWTHLEHVDLGASRFDAVAVQRRMRRGPRAGLGPEQGNCRVRRRRELQWSTPIMGERPRRVLDARCPVARDGTIIAAARGFDPTRAGRRRTEPLAVLLVRPSGALRGNAASRGLRRRTPCRAPRRNGVLRRHDARRRRAQIGPISTAVALGSAARLPAGGLDTGASAPPPCSHRDSVDWDVVVALRHDVQSSSSALDAAPRIDWTYTSHAGFVYALAVSDDDTIRLLVRATRTSSRARNDNRIAVLATTGPSCASSRASTRPVQPRDGDRPDGTIVPRRRGTPIWRLPARDRGDRPESGETCGSTPRGATGNDNFLRRPRTASWMSPSPRRGSSSRSAPTTIAAPRTGAGAAGYAGTPRGRPRCRDTRRTRRACAPIIMSGRLLRPLPHRCAPGPEQPLERRREPLVGAHPEPSRPTSRHTDIDRDLRSTCRPP